MCTPGERDRVQDMLLARAEADGAIAGAAFTGSYATGHDDRWSDTDLVLAVSARHGRSSRSRRRTRILSPG